MPKFLRRFLLALPAFLAPALVHAQAVQATPNLGIVANGFVYALAPMPDGDWVVGGEFTSINGVARRNLARLNADGSVDAAWNPGADGEISALVATTAGDVFVGGEFNTIGGMGRVHVAELSGASGTVTAWQAGVEPSEVGALAIDGSGRLLVGGIFGDSWPYTHLQRFSATTGAVDAGLLASPDGLVQRIAVEAGGSLLIAGSFSHVSGVARRGLARVDANGQLVAGWDAGGNGEVTAVAVGPDGARYVAGDFTQIGGAARSGLAKLDAAGVADASWNPGGANGRIEALALDGDRLYVGGAFTQIAGGSRRNLARMDAIGTGTLDAGWTLQADDAVRVAAATASGELWLGGEFRNLDADLRMGLARLTAAAALAPRTDVEMPAEVTRIQPLANGAAAIAGSFLKVDGAAHRHLARIRADGSVDHAFLAQANSTVAALAVAGSSLYVGGAFTDISGTARSRLAKLDATTGAIDPTWVPAADGVVEALTSTGSELFAAGYFHVIGGVSRSYLAKLALAGSGSVDTGFDAQANAPALVLHSAGSGRLLVSGQFVQIGGATRTAVALLSTTNGSALPWNAVVTGSVRAMTTDASGRVYLGGQISAAQGVPLCKLARFDGTSGALDTRWLPSTGQGIAALAVIDGALFVGGEFSTLSGTPRIRLAKLSLSSPFPERDWSADLDPSEMPVASALAAIGTNLWVAGRFSRVGGQPRTSLAALTAGAQTLFSDSFEAVPGGCS